MPRLRHKGLLKITKYLVVLKKEGVGKRKNCYKFTRQVRSRKPPKDKSVKKEVTEGWTCKDNNNRKIQKQVTELPSAKVHLTS